jgi:hypothetical protein
LGLFLSNFHVWILSISLFVLNQNNKIWILKNLYCHISINYFFHQEGRNRAKKKHSMDNFILIGRSKGKWWTLPNNNLFLPNKFDLMSSKSKKITTKSSHLVGIQKHHMCEPLKIKSKPPYQILINISWDYAYIK